MYNFSQIWLLLNVMKRNFTNNFWVTRILILWENRQSCARFTCPAGYGKAYDFTNLKCQGVQCTSVRDRDTCCNRNILLFLLFFHVVGVHKCYQAHVVNLQSDTKMKMMKLKIQSLGEVLTSSELFQFRRFQILF